MSDGVAQLIARIDEAVQMPDPEAITLRVKRELQDAIRARTIFYDHRCVPHHAQVVRNDTRQQVGCAARRKSDHNANWPIWKIGCGARRPDGRWCRARPRPPPPGRGATSGA